MKNISNQELKLPAHMQKDLNLQLSNMHRVAKAAIHALNEESEIYSYAFYKTVSTVATMSFWKRASKTDGANPEMEAWMDQRIKSYLSEMEKIPQEACEKILLLLQGMPLETIPDIGLLDEVVMVFRRRLAE